ncbi:hypothetical protein LSAT2_033038 [Lamellibrachia satsuma]|nr:hypothetical protein LSAT2_033038 [Lamellibrachia satsuma]
MPTRLSTPAFVAPNFMPCVISPAFGLGVFIAMWHRPLKRVEVGLYSTETLYLVPDNLRKLSSLASYKRLVVEPFLFGQTLQALGLKEEHANAIVDNKYYVTVQAINYIEFGPPALTVCHAQSYAVDTTPPIIYAVDHVAYDEATFLISYRVNAT